MKNQTAKIASGLILAASAMSSSARAQSVGTNYTFTSNHTVTERNGLHGGNTASSYMAASAMGAKGHSNYDAGSALSWESNVLPKCQSQSGFTLWPQGCSPTGMADTLRRSDVTGRSWITSSYGETQQADANQKIVSALKNHGSPAVVPIFGQADHWVAITQVIGRYESNGTYTILQVKAFDGGSAAFVDSSYNSYMDGVQSWGAATWNNVFFKVLTAINPSCDPNCTSDPFYKKFLVTWEPPPNAPPDHSIGAFAKAPGILVAGRHMNEQIAQTRLWDALTAGSVDEDAEIWSAIQGGVPGAAWLVHGVWPSGLAWDYYLVPILSNTTTAMAFVQLDASDGSFQGIHIPTAPVSFAPKTMNEAERLARATLSHGERLTGGLLTWDPNADAAMNKAPSYPYYEFGVMGIGNQDAGMIRVALKDGTTVRSQ